MTHNIFHKTLITATTIILCCIQANAQPRDDWKEQMRSDKIAFLSMEIGLTPDEAQKFWPIYNEVSEQLDKAMHDVFHAYKDLETAINEDRSEKEISKLLEVYLDALENQNEIKDDSVDKYRRVLTDKKIAKVFLAEEKFRRQHIRRLHQKHHD